MPTLRFQVSFGADSALPRDRFVITPHFNTGFSIVDDVDANPDVQALTDDLAEALDGWMVGPGSREIVVKAYNAEQLRGNFPLATTVRNANAYPLSSIFRELSMCLSYFSERNVPRRRGRLYIPAQLMTTSNAVPPRPDVGYRTQLAALAPIFQNLGGANVDWVVWSRADAAARPVTNWWIDDEWDIQRRRGLRGTTRTLGTTSEAGVP